jgi:hypothetical protein
VLSCYDHFRRGGGKFDLMQTVLPGISSGKGQSRDFLPFFCRAVSGEAYRARPASAATHAPAAHRASDPVLTITAGGDRIGDTAVAGLPGETFAVYTGTQASGPRTKVGECVTGASGTCQVDVDTVASGQGYWVEQVSVPAGWSATPSLGIRPNSTAGTARGSVWAASRDEPSIPEVCGLKVALLFDLSTSVEIPQSHLPQLKAAGREFVDALTGTPSSVGLFTFGSYAPANHTNNGNLELTR